MNRGKTYGISQNLQNCTSSLINSEIRLVETMQDALAQTPNIPADSYSADCQYNLGFSHLHRQFRHRASVCVYEVQCHKLASKLC